MRKNLLLIHLESISRANLWQYRVELGTLWRLMSLSRQYTKFYSVSTSTMMTMTDVLWGVPYVYDTCYRFDDVSQRVSARHIQQLSLGERLVKCGWEWGMFLSSPFQPIGRTREEDGIKVNNPDVSCLIESLLREYKKHRDEKKSFAAYYWDDSSHLAYASKEKQDTQSVQERMRVAYRRVDANLNMLFRGLMELGLWENTVVVGFGDHGDEPWVHGLNRGYAHSLAPYSGLCWVPMFIFDNEEKGSIDTTTGSTADLHQTVFAHMIRNVDLTEEQKAATIFPPPPFTQGIDLFHESLRNLTRKRIISSQNMFALQLERDDPELGMVKGYGATDGDYRLVVSSGGGNPEKGGMELFYEQMDPTNSRNLLDFFEMDENGDIVDFNPPPDTVGKHFRTAFRPPQVESIIVAFKFLKRELIRRVRTKEGDACNFCREWFYTDKWEFFPEHPFSHAKRRMRVDN